MATLLLNWYSQRYPNEALTQNQIRITSEDSTNTILVQAAPADLDEIRSMIERIDDTVSSAVNELRIVPVRNALASDMATLIVKMGQYQEASIAYFTKHILADRERTLRLAVHVGWSMIRKTVRGLGAVVIKRDRPLALVLSQAIYAWRGPLALYRSHRRAGVKHIVAGS